jgi:putative phosphoesterase
MKVALISDQHANDVAFQATLEDIERIGVDSIVCLGDVAQGGAQPAETLDRLKALGCQTVLGNSDAFLLELPTDSPELMTEQQLEVREWTVARLDESHLAFMRTFEPALGLELDGVRMLCFHGSPRSYDDLLLPEHEEASLASFLGFDVDLLAGGHAHRQWARVIGGALYVNPGSVGLAYDHHQAEQNFRVSPFAEYALAFLGGQGPGIEFRRVPFSVEAVRAAADASGRPDAATWAAQWSAPGSA